jgi:transposase
MTPEAMKQVFARIPQSFIAMEMGTHSPWVSRLLTELWHKVIVAYAQKLQLITKSNRKDDRHDARTLARLARIDPELLGPVRHRSAHAQIHLTVIRARTELVRARTALVNAARGLVKSYGQRLPECGTQQEGLDSLQSVRCHNHGDLCIIDTQILSWYLPHLTQANIFVSYSGVIWAVDNHITGLCLCQKYRAM